MTINKTTETQHIDPKTYLALANFVSKDKTRFYLHGIYIEPGSEGSTIMAATDGRVLGAYENDDMTCVLGEGVIVKVTPDTLKAAKALLKQPGVYMELTGDHSAATNTGHRSVSTVEGEQSVAIVTGYQSRAKAVEGSWIVVAERDDDLNIIDIKAALAGRDVKPDTFYVLKDGEFVEAGE